MLQSDAANAHLKLLGGLVSVGQSLTCGVAECNIAHHRSVAVLFRLYSMWCNPMHPFYDALPDPPVPVRVKRGAVVAHRYT